MTAAAADSWALPAGRHILPPDAPQDVWRRERQLGIGSSDIALLMGVAHYSFPYELWMSKTGRSEGEPFNWAMQRGHWLESGIAQYFAERTGLELRPCGLVAHLGDDRLRATPDRLTSDGGLVEVKSFQPTAKVALEWREGIAQHAYVQGQWQALVTGRTPLWWVAYPIDREPLIRGPVDLDDELCERMRVVAITWWEQHVVTDDPPPVDLAAVTDREIALRWPVEEPGAVREAQWPAHVAALLAERGELLAQESNVRSRKKEIDSALKVMVGDAETLAINGRPVLTFRSVGNPLIVDPALETELPEVWATYIKQTASRRIHICKGRKYE